VIAAAEQTKAVADAAAKVEAAERANDIRSITGIGTNEGRDCFRDTRYIHTSNIGSHYENYVPCADSSGSPVSGDCAFCGTLGKCCARGVRAGSCTGSEGGSSGHVCVAGESIAVVKATAAATGKYLIIFSF